MVSSASCTAWNCVCASVDITRHIAPHLQTRGRKNCGASAAAGASAHGIRDALGQAMTPEQIEEAHQLARDRLASSCQNCSESGHRARHRALDTAKCVQLSDTYNLRKHRTTDLAVGISTTCVPGKPFAQCLWTSYRSTS